MQASDTTFVNRELCVEQAPHAQTVAQLEERVRVHLAEKREHGDFNQAAVYFVELDNGAMFGIDEDLQFVPASLPKLPLAFVYFALEADEPGALQEELVYSPPAVQAPIPVQNEHAPDELRVGERYSVETLLRVSITHSDNVAYLVLLEHLMERPNGAQLFHMADEPYSLCVMTKGRDFATLEATVAGVSRLVYEHLEPHAD